jgi:YegS/Rv2252/BmrU family lipid kinase
MPRKRTKLILNPNANLGQAWQHASDLRPIVDEYGGADWTGTVYPTHATDLALQAAREGYELVIAVGGDGTVHEVVNGLMQIPKEKRPKLGVVPLGSGNDFSHNIGMNTRPELALKQVLTSKGHFYDVGVIEDEHGRREYWDNTINIGFGGSVNVYSHSLPVVRGFLMYLTAVILTIIRHYDVFDMEITTDEKSWEDEVMMLVLCNGPREGGGFHSGPGSIMDDGILNYTLLSRVSRLMMFRLIPEFMKGTQGRFKQVKTGLMKKIEIKSKQPLYIHTDGETYAGFASNVHHLKVEILPQALEIMVPDKKEA